MKILPVVLSALTFANVGYAQQSDICSTHTVARGETLRLIAEKYLGARDQSPAIYAVNRSTVGSDPNFIAVGMVLNIPCTAGETPSATAQAPAAAPAVEATVAATDPAPVEVIETPPAVVAEASATRALTAPASFSGGFLALSAEAPFTGAELEGGGLMPRLVTTTLDYAGVSTPPIGISTMGIAASLDAMTKNAALEIGFPVIRPDCASPNLNTLSSRLCGEFYFSSPLFEIVTSLFARTVDELQIFTAEDLAGRVICIPDFYPFEELQDLGLALDSATMLEPGTLQSCFDALRAGDVDMVYADFLGVNETVGDISLSGEFEALSRFSWIKTVHAVSYNGNADGAETLTTINQGLAAIIFGKEWRSIMIGLLS